MIPFILGSFILFKRIYPFAKSKGRNGILWALIAISIFVAAMFIIQFSLGLLFLIIDLLFGSNLFDNDTALFISGIVGVIGGLLCGDSVKRFLNKKNQANLLLCRHRRQIFPN
jgi:cell division protein FtsX